jgi:hypothetical protein
MSRRPTFEMLRERGELQVVYPATRRRFTISLRDWAGVLWAVKIIPAVPQAADGFNPFAQQHRLLSRPCIEEWLERLRLVRIRLRR